MHTRVSRVAVQVGVCEHHGHMNKLLRLTLSQPESGAPSPHLPRGRVGWRRRWLPVLGLLSLLLVVLIVERVRGQRALRSHLHRLEQAQEIISADHWIPPAPPPQQNAALALFGLTNQLSSFSNQLSTVLPSRRVTTPGRAVVAHTLTEWYPSPDITNTWEDVRHHLEERQGLLGSIQAALQRPKFHSGFNHRAAFPDFAISGLREMAQLFKELQLQALYELHRSDPDAAVRSLQLELRFVALLREEVPAMSQMIRQSLAGFVANATWEAIQSHQLSDAHLRALQRSWRECQFIESMTRSLHGERAIQIDLFERLRTSSTDLARFVAQCDEWNKVGDHQFGRFATHGWIRRCIQLPLWKFAWCHQDTLRSLEAWDQIFANHRIATQQSWAALHSTTALSDTAWLTSLTSPDQEDIRWFTRFRFPFSTLPGSISDAMTRRTLLAQTQQQMVLVALALERYRLENQEFPPDLTVLIPKFLEAMPQDHLGGGALRYQPASKGTYLLYSVGNNGQDDGGDAHPDPKEEILPTVSGGRDFVWPLPASPSEAQEALLKAR